MKIGKLDKRIELQQSIRPPDGRGGSSAPWITKATVWAEFKKPNLQIAESTGTIISVLIREIGIRYRTDVRKGWQVKYGGKTFSVEHTYDYGKTTTILVCREVVR